MANPIAKKAGDNNKSALLWKAREMSPFMRALIALVPPQPGQKNPVREWIGQLIPNPR